MSAATCVEARGITKSQKKGSRDMLYYVAHSYDGTKECYERVKELVQDMQVDDWENCYLCPVLAFPFADCDADKMAAIKLDLLSVCDIMLVVSERTKDLQAEIDFAGLIGMEIYDV